MRPVRNFSLIILLFLVFIQFNVFGQNTTKDIDSLIVTGTVIIDGDTIPNVSLKEVVVFPRIVFKSRRQYRRYNKLVRDVTKAYPYAKYAKIKLDEMESEFLELKTEKERERYAKTVEKQLMHDFGDELKKLTITQGRILLKLIDRETGDTSYELLKQLRGSFSAVFWQTIARIFGSDLKSQYDASGDDYLIERVVLMIEAGQIQIDQNVYKRLKMPH